MSRAWRSLRVQLALVGSAAIYLPVLLLFGVGVATEDETATVVDGIEVTRDASPPRSPWVPWTVVALAPTAAGLAWWWAGRATRPLDRVRTVAEDIEGADLSRRIGLDRGPAEVVALAASFDAMLDRLERSAEIQRRLVEEASHELRTPLAVLTTNAEVLLGHPEPTLGLYREGLERSQAAAVRLRATVEELLVDARGRARTVARQPVDLAAIVRAVVDEAGVPAGSRRIELAIAGPPSVPGALDGPTVHRAVANLVDNAIRHAPSGSTVEVAVEEVGGEGGAEVAVVVVDHGPGIPIEEQGHAFERFWHGRADGAGTGLGLPIARQVARAHGGDLTVASPGPAGDGCAFTLRLRR